MDIMSALLSPVHKTIERGGLLSLYAEQAGTRHNSFDLLLFGPLTIGRVDMLKKAPHSGSCNSHSFGNLRSRILMYLCVYFNRSVLFLQYFQRVLPHGGPPWLWGIQHNG